MSHQPPQPTPGATATPSTSSTVTSTNTYRPPTASVTIPPPQYPTQYAYPYAQYSPYQHPGYAYQYYSHPPTTTPPVPPPAYKPTLTLSNVSSTQSQSQSQSQSYSQSSTAPATQPSQATQAPAHAPAKTAPKKTQSLKGTFTRELRTMMYAFGDSKEPAPDSIDVMEEILIEYLMDVCHTALAPTRKTRIQIEDLRRALSRFSDGKKLARLEELLFMQDDIRRGRKLFSTEEDQIQAQVID